MKKLVQSLFLLLFVASVAFAQDRTVTGTVKAKEDGLPLPGVSVKVKGTNLGIQSDANGKYSLKVPSGSNTIIFSFIGFLNLESTIPTTNVLNVSLASDNKILNEVVVTAGGLEVSKRELGNASTSISAATLTQAKPFNVASGLTGKVAGLQVNAVSSGVNPNVRLVLRGNRSLLGNNQALVVLDNVIVPNSILGNLNPEDIENIQVLNGAGAAALYGSEASNGALIITTKKGKVGPAVIKLSNTTNVESVSYLPKLQKSFGSGTGNDDVPSYTPFENQQYGPAFDGSLRQIGRPLSDGSIQTVPYAASTAKDDFWENGINNQTDFSISSADVNSSYYISGQYFDQVSTVPGDKYNRFSLRLNGTRDLGNKVDLSFTANYVQNRYDLSTATGTAFNDLLQSPSQIPVTNYKNWRTDKFANPNGYYNDYYDNPYFTLDNNRQNVRNDYLTGNTQLRYSPAKWVTLTGRVGISTRNNSGKNYQGVFNFTDYTRSVSSSKTDINGAIGDSAGYSTQLLTDLFAEFKKDINKDLKLKFLTGYQGRNNNSKSVSISANGLAIPGLYNISNILANPNAGEGSATTRQYGVYGKFTANYKSYLYLTVQGRNDWVSVLAVDNQSFFYPAADVSFVASDALGFLKKSKVIDELKLRGGVSKVGNVNIGAYSLVPTFGQGAGYPYNSVPGFGLSSRIVSNNLKPEITTGFETGFDLSLFDGKITTNATYYQTTTDDQTVPIQISSATGFSSFLTNTGTVSNKGLETAIRVTPIRKKDLEVSVGANYTRNVNNVESISNSLPQINLFGNAASRVIAQEGKPFPYLQATNYQKDPQGRIIVDRLTGYPTVSTDFLDVGQTDPTDRLGLDASVRWKQFSFATVFEYRTGNFIYNSVATGYDFSGAGIRTISFNRERFVVPNSSYLDPTNAGSYIANNSVTVRNGGTEFWTDGPHNTAVGSNYIHSAAFWKLRELSLSYTVPTKFLGGTKFVKGATLALQGRNLFQWVPNSNIYSDPEFSAAGADSNAIGITTLGQTPPSRYYGATVSFTF
jgi:TonB-linked SusC/RagA family outer membrane protein